VAALSTWIALNDKVGKKETSSILVLLMPVKPLIRLYGKYYSATAVSVSPRMRMAVLAWRVRRVRVYPRFSHIQSFDIVLGEVA
jgi:hypothetical protein